MPQSNPKQQIPDSFYRCAAALTAEAMELGIFGGVGNISASIANTNYVGKDTNSVGYFEDGKLYEGALAVATLHAWTTGQRTDYALDMTNHKLWVREPTSNNWNNDVIGNQNPATNTGGFTLPASVYASAVCPGTSIYNATTPDNTVAHFASGSWVGTAPAGFGAP